MAHLIHTALETVADYFILGLDAIGIIVMLIGAVHSVYMLCKKQHHIILYFSNFMNTALLFRLAAEIVRLTFVHTLSELALVAGFIGLHSAISFLIQWETRREAIHSTMPEEKAEVGEDIYM